MKNTTCNLKSVLYHTFYDYSRHSINGYLYNTNQRMLGVFALFYNELFELYKGDIYIYILITSKF